MADEEDLVSNVRVDGVEESTKKLEEFGKRGAEAFDKVSEAAAGAEGKVAKSTSDIDKNVASANRGFEEFRQNLRDTSQAAKPTAEQLKQIEQAANDLTKRTVKVSKDLAQFAKKIAALGTAGVAAIAGIAKLGASVAEQVNQTTSAFDKNNAAQQRAVAETLNNEQAAIQYVEQQRQLNRQLADGSITYDQYSAALKSNKQARQDTIRVTEQMKSAEEAARIETERLQKVAADHKVYDDLTKTFGGPLTASLIALGSAAIATKNKFIEAFGPAASGLVDTLTKALSDNGAAITAFFAAAGAKLSAFVSQNGPAIQKALSSIGTAVASVFNGLITALPILLDLFNNQLVPAVRAVAGFIDGLVKGFNQLFGTNLTTGAAVVVTALISMTGALKIVLGLLGLISPAFIVLRAILLSLTGPVGLLVAAFALLYVSIDWQKFGANAVAAGQAILNFFTSLPGTITSLFTGMFDLIGTGWSKLAEDVVAGWNAVIEFFTSLPGVIGGIFTAIGDTILSAFTSAFDSVKSYIMSWVEPIKKILQPIIDMIEKIASGGGGDSAAASDAPGFARGGKIRGPGTSTSDSILAWLSNSEFVMQAKAVRKYGTDFMHAINSGRLDLKGLIQGFAGGGTPFGSLAPAPVSFASQSSGGGGGGVLNLTIGEQSFNGLRIPDQETADSLAKYAVQRQIASGGRKPSWTLPRR